MTTPARSSRRRRHRADRIVASGLAVAACVGVVTVIGVRSAEPTGAPGEAGEPLTADGLSRADLDAYARDLVDEGVRLSAYREQLRALAVDLAAELEALEEAEADGAPVDPSALLDVARSLERAPADGDDQPLPAPDTSSYSS